MVLPQAQLADQGLGNEGIRGTRVHQTEVGLLFDINGNVQQRLGWGWLIFFTANQARQSRLPQLLRTRSDGVEAVSLVLRWFRCHQRDQRGNLGTSVLAIESMVNTWYFT